MDAEQYYEVIDKLFAFDSGCTDSGVMDELIREKVKGKLESMSEDEVRIFLSIYIRERFLAEKALKNGYGIEDVSYFINWLDEYMEFTL